MHTDTNAGTVTCTYPTHPPTHPCAVGKGTGRRTTGRLQSLAGGSTFNKALAQNVAAEKVQMYGQAFEKIQGATGIEDIDVLVNSFISAGE
jgi:hypothetical protein